MADGLEGIFDFGDDDDLITEDTEEVDQPEDDGPKPIMENIPDVLQEYPEVGDIARLMTEYGLSFKHSKELLIKNGNCIDVVVASLNTKKES